QAFTERMPASVAPPISPAAAAVSNEKTVLAFAPKPKRQIPRWTWAAAAAAVLAIVSLAAIQIAKSTSSPAGIQANGAEPIAIPKTNERKEINSPQHHPKHNPIAGVIAATRKGTKSSAAPQMIAVKENHKRVEPQASESEITTDYIPLTYVAGT